MKTTKGVSLVEVMIAIVLISVSFGTIIGLQGRMLRRSIINARAIEYAIAVQNMFAEIHRTPNNPHYPREKTIGDLNIVITYAREKPKPASVLSKINHLMVERIENREKTLKPYIRLMAQFPRETAS